MIVPRMKMLKQYARCPEHIWMKKKKFNMKLRNSVIFKKKNRWTSAAVIVKLTKEGPWSTGLFAEMFPLWLLEFFHKIEKSQIDK